MIDLPRIEVEYKGFKGTIEPAVCLEHKDKYKWEIKVESERDNNWRPLGINLYYPDISEDGAKQAALQALNSARKDYICFLEAEIRFAENRLKELKAFDAERCVNGEIEPCNCAMH